MTYFIARTEFVIIVHFQVSFNALNTNLLVSGSQDSMICLFDLRSYSSSLFNISANIESVRDVQFSPHYENKLASVSENGFVTLWDIRRMDKYEKSWPAHAENVFACDWHPEVKTIM